MDEDLRAEFLERIVRRIYERALAEQSSSEFRGWLLGITGAARDGALDMELRRLLRDE